MGHTSEDRVSTPAQTCCSAVKSPKILKNEQFDRMCQKWPSSCWNVSTYFANGPAEPSLDRSDEWAEDGKVDV